MSNEIKFTIGDWELGHGKTYCAVKHVGSGAVIADMRTVGSTYNKYNANLIKTSPKLYFMLSGIFEVLNGDTEFSVDEINLIKIKEVLAEARGE